MKKIFSLVLSLLTLTSVQANLILHEPFAQEVGTLNAGQNTDMGGDMTKWWSYSGTDKYIEVEAGSLSYAGYVSEGTANKAVLAGNGADDLRQFAAITSGKVFAATIINVEELKSNTTGDYFLTFGDATTSGMFGRLFAKATGSGDTYQLGIGKQSETAVYAEQTLSTKTDYLVVVEYEIVDGAKNDIARLYINPTAETTEASATTGETANTKTDASKIASINLRKGTNTPTKVYVDEIKVATAWADLFEGNGQENEPVITPNPGYLFFMDEALGEAVLVGASYKADFYVSAQNLTEDITLSCSSDELALSATTISKNNPNLADGVKIEVTLTPKTAAVEGKQETITLASGKTSITVSASWAAYAPVQCADVAALKTAVAASEPYTTMLQFTGEAIVTYIERTDYWTDSYIIEDATGAVRLDTYQMEEAKIGDKVTNLIGTAGEAVFGIQPFSVMSAITVVSSGNSITPQEVTLEDLQDFAKDYLLELVEVKGVAIDNAEPAFKAGNNAITQDGISANINLLEGNPLIGTTKPANANVVGISSSTAGNIIRPRTVADIVAIAAPATIEVSPMWFTFYAPEETGAYYIGDTRTGTFTVTGTDLTEDITIACSTDQIAVSPATISKADAANGVEVAFTITFSEVCEGATQTITLSTANAEDAVITLIWGMVMAPPAEYADIATLKGACADIEPWSTVVTYTGEAVVTFVEAVSAWSNNYIIEDATGATQIVDEYGMASLQVGDKVSGLLLMNGEKSFGIQTFWLNNPITALSSGNSITPQVVTLAELQANAADYLLELVQVKGVAIDLTEPEFTKGNNAITQDGVSANINLNEGNPLIGTKKTEKAADVTGISINTAGTAIRPRTEADIVEAGPTTAIEHADTDEASTIYTIFGQQVSNLQSGINIIRKGNTTYKVVR